MVRFFESWLFFWDTACSNKTFNRQVQQTVIFKHFVIHKKQQWTNKTIAISAPCFFFSNHCAHPASRHAMKTQSMRKLCSATLIHRLTCSKHIWEGVWDNTKCINRRQASILFLLKYFWIIPNSLEWLQQVMYKSPRVLHLIANMQPIRVQVMWYKY